MLTLITDIPATPLRLRIPPGYALGPCRSSDISNLGRLYFEAYDPGVACASLGGAIADIQAAFAGAYGELWREASFVATIRGERLAAAIQVVRRAPWPDTPDCPFVIELFTARDHRRQGLARTLVNRAMGVVAGAHHGHLALHVDEHNIPALCLYQSLGFRVWRA